MHYTLFIIVCGRIKLMLLLIEFSMCQIFETINDVFWIWSNFIEIFFNWQCFISITVTFKFNIIVTPKTIYSYWFIIFFFIMLKKFLIFLSILSLIPLVSFSSLRRSSLIFNYVFFFKPYIFHYYILQKKNFFQKEWRFIILLKKHSKVLSLR